MPGRGWAVGSIVVGFVISMLSSASLLPLVREQLHYRCSYAAEGEGAGSFMCADGIGYVGVVVFTVGLNALFAAVGFIVLWWPGAQRMLPVAAILPLAVFSWSTWYATTNRSFDGAPGANYWVEPLLPVTVLLAIAVLLLLASAFVSSPSWRRGVLFVTVGLLVAALLTQPGCAAAAAMSAALIGAAIVVAEGREPGARPQLSPAG